MDKHSLRDASLPQPLQSDSRGKQFWDGINSQLSSPPAAAAPKRDLETEWSDYPKAVGAGALDLVGGIGELARQASNFGKENAGKQGGDYLEQARANMANKLSPLLDVVAGAGDLAASGAESLNDGMSADAKEALGRRLVDETPEGRLTLGDGAGDIDVWAMKMAQGVGSLLPTLAAGGVTGVAAKASIGRAVTASMVKRGATQEVAEAVAAKAVSKIATGAAVTTGATGSVGSAGVNTRDTVLGMSFDELAASDTFRQSFTRIDQDQQTSHLSDEEKLGLAREETANLASRATMSDAKVWGAAAMGSMMGDAALFKMLAGKAAAGGVLKGAGKGAVGEGIGETLEEGVQQYAINESLNEVAAAEIDPMKGVVSSALEGGLIGMGTGGAVGAVGGARGGKHASAEEGVGADPVSEPVAPVTEEAAGPAVDPNFVSAPLEDGEQVPSASQAEGDLNPLGPSGSQFDELRDVPAYLRQDDTADRFKGMAQDSDVQRALAGEYGRSVQDLVTTQMQAGDQGKSLYELAQAGDLGVDPFAGNKSALQVAAEGQRPALPLKDVIFAGDANAKPAGEAVAAPGDHDDQQAGPGPQFRGGERTRWQNGQEGDLLPPEAATAHPAGELPGAVIDGESREVGTELPHRDVIYGADNRQPDATHIKDDAPASAEPDSILGPLKTLRITRKGKPFASEKEAAMASRKGKEIPVPLNGGGFGVAEIAEVEQVRVEQPTSSQPQQLAPAVDTGYRDVIPSSEQSEVTHGQPTPIPEISSERSGDQPGAGDPVATSVGPTPAELAERAGPGDPADGASLAPVPVTQPGEENSLTAPAPAGVAVSEEAQAEQARTTAGPAAAPTPWSEMIDNPDGTITLKGEVPIIKQWAKDNGVKAIPGKGGLVVAKSFTAKVRGLTAPPANEPSALVEAARGGVVPEPTEVDLIDRDLLKEHAGRWKYRSAVGAGWFTSNTKEGAIDRAREAYRRAFEKGDPLPTREERWEQSEREFAGRMDNRFGGMTINELEKRHQNLGGTIADLQLAGRHEMNGNGGRRTGAAVANEGARQAGQEKMDLERYIQLRREREEMAGSAPARMIEAARSEVAPEPTEAQKEAGNYKKGHITLQGLDIALENPKGSTRSGTDQDGRAWQSTMAHDYGYIKRTLGADGDHVDVFIGDKPDSETVYVVDQVDPKTGKFDEHKVMMGFSDEQAAREGYLGNYEDGWKGLGAIKAMPVDAFKRWVKEGDTTKPAASHGGETVGTDILTDDEAMAVADELGIVHDNPDDVRWELENVKPATLAAALKRVRNPSRPVAFTPRADNPNIVAAPPVDDDNQHQGKSERAISFSKQAMAQGDKPAKALTRKEAELVTKEWFKQYRGASGIDVQIHATQAELEKALGLTSKDGLIRRAAFDDDSGALHVAADTIADPKRMREILRHEVLAHYGLANVLGDGEYTKLMSRLIQSQKDPSMKPVWDWVNTHYADEDIGTQAEEVVAHLAEVEQGAWGRGWDRVVAMVTRALRAVGFVPDGITAAETRVLIEGLGKKMTRSGPDNGGPDGGQKFSQEAGKQSDPFTPNMGEADAYRQQLKNAMSSLKSGEIVIEIGHTPAVLRRVGAPDLPLRITRDIVRKATNGVKHDVPMHVIEKMPELLHDPVAVFDSRTEPDAKTILVDAVDTSGRPVITAIHLNAKAGRVEINRIASVYGKDNGIGAMERWIDEGLLRYAREKQNPLGTTQGLQLPKRGSPERVYDSNILTKDDIRKGGIKMSQSIADNSPSLEQSITQKAKYQAGAALGSVKNYIKQKRPVMLGTLTDLQIDQVYRDITGGAVSEYQRLRTQMEADRNDILLDAEIRIDPLWDALDKQVKTALSNLMHDATMARLHPDKSLDENSYYLEAKQKVERAKKPETKAAYEAELHIIERNHSELARQYNALPANAKALYDTMQDTYTKQWESLRGAIEQRLEDLLGVNQGRAMAAEMRQKMEHALQHGPYFPLTRYGDYVVKARKGDEYVREHFERRADAEQAVKQYQRDGYNAVMTVKEEGGGDSANANQLGMEMLSFLDSADGVSKSALKDEIWQAMLRMMPDASYAKHAIHRRRVKGASRDAHRAYLNSVYHYARHVSKIRYGHKMQGELDKLSEQIRAGVAGEPSSLKPEDLEIAQQVLNEMNKRHDLNMNPTGKAWAGSAGNIGFLYYIGPSVASAVVNMTQNFTVMLPQLGAKYGFAKSAAAMTQALGDYVKHGKFKAGTTEAWHSLTRSTTLPADERAILDRLYRAGALDLTQAHSIAAKADTDQQDAKPMGKRWRRAMRWAGATFHNAEVLNREVAALAAYRLLKQAEPTLNGQQYADRVAEMVYDGHGNYAASNRPRYMRNDITKVLTQFKIYSQMMTYVLYSNAIKAAKGDKVAQKTLAGVLATHWVMAGVMGLPTPITAVVYAIAAGLDDDDDRSGEASFRLALTEALGPRAGELLAKGPMDALTNLSIAGRTGLGDLWWRSPKEGTEGDDLAWHAVQQLLGPVAGIGINLARGAGQMTDGHIQRGLETMLPKSIRDVAKSYRQATEGEQTIKGDIIMDDVSTWNVAMQGLGFGSAQMAKNYDAREYIKGKEKRIADKRSQLLTDYYMARKSGEMDEVQEVLERIKMFNSINHPRERITGKSLALSFKSKLRSNERTQGGVYLNRNREYLREEGRFAD